MSIFSKIKGASKAAKEHKKKSQEPAADAKDVAVPYKHIPTHAAVDALSGAPSSWREEDRSAIKAQHKRRSMMTRNDSSISATLNRNDSSISATLNRNSSYGYNNSFRGSEFGMVPARLDARRSYVGSSSYQPSPLNSHGVSPAVSDANSTSSSSSQLVEMPYGGNRNSGINMFDNLHKSTKRKVGEAPQWAQPPPTLVKKEPAAIITPVEVKKRSWGFRRNNRQSAIAAH